MLRDDTQSTFSLCLHHRLHTVSAEDIDLFRGSDTLTAAGANQLPGAAGAFLAGDRRSSRADCSRGSDMGKGRQRSTVDFDF